jgi:DNA polymerase III alpha subunit (gram-positive type)
MEPSEGPRKKWYEQTHYSLDLEWCCPDGPEGDEVIVEIGIQRYRHDEKQYIAAESFESLLSDAGTLNDESARISGITSDDIQGKPKLAQVVKEYKAIVKGTHFGLEYSNMRKGEFRLGMDDYVLQKNLERAGHELQHSPVMLDVCTMLKWIDSDVRYPKSLGCAAKWYRTESQPCHRALADARAAAEIFHVIAKDVHKEMDEPETVNQVVKQVDKWQRQLEREYNAWAVTKK